MISLKSIIEDVFGIEDMVSSSRQRKYIDARMVYCKILKDRGHTFVAIGKSLGKDHATVIHHVVKSEYLLKAERDLHDKYLRARAEFLCDREVFYKNPTQRDMINRINSLTNQLETYIVERERVLMKEDNFRRLMGIIDLLSEKLPKGKELLAERKIRRMLNLEIM